MGANYRRPVNRQVKLESGEAESLKEKLVVVNRVAKVVKGGRRFSFSALVVVGDERGRVGYGLGKANEVPECIRKATELARRRMVWVPLNGHTIPYEVEGFSGSAHVILKPASPGTGVIAGGVVRSLLEKVGVKDILSKSIGSQNPHNVLSAVLDALVKIESVDEVCSRRAIQLDGMDYKPYGAH